MRRLFVNLNAANAATAPLPGILAVSRPEGPYFGRVIHAEADHYAPARSRRLPPYRHRHYHIVLVTEGSGFFAIDDAMHPAREGMVFLTSPRQPHQFLNAEGDTTRYAELTFEFLRADGHPLALDFAAMLSAWVRRRCDPLVSRALPPVQARVLAGAMAALADRGLAAPRPDDLELGGLLAEVLVLVYRMVFERAGVPEDPVGRARELIRARYREPLRMAALAAEVGLSPSHFSRRFKKRFGRAPVDYQLDLRLQSACQLLRTSAEPLAGIAAAVGFDDVYYFSRLFRRRMGEPPGRFRRGVQAGPDSA